MEKKHKRKVTLKEEIIAAVLLFIGVGLILLYVFSAKLYMDSETETIQMRLLDDAYTITGSGEQFEDYDNSLDIKTDENGVQYIEKLRLDASTYLKAVENGGYKLLSIDKDGKETEDDETIITDDSGNSIEMEAYGSFVTSKLNGNAINSFTLDEHIIEIKDNTYYADGIAVKLPDNEVETTVKSSENTTNSSAASTKTSNTTVTAKSSAERSVAATTTTKATSKKVKKTTTTKATTKKVKKKTTTTTAETSYVSPNSDLNEVVNLVNQERASRGIAPLKMKLVLNKMAQVRAKESSKYFSHTRPSGDSAETIMADYGVSYTLFGENLASGAKTPAEVVQQWMDSAPHKAAILNKKFEYIGVGYYYYKNDPEKSYYYWSQIFYTP